MMSTGKYDEAIIVCSSPRSTACELHAYSSVTLLLDMARIQDWSSMLIRIQTHPKEVEFAIDNEGLLPLHWSLCCENPSYKVVERLLAAYPNGAVRNDNVDGFTALHFACHYGVPNILVLRLLLRYNPYAISHRDAHGRTPLYLVCARNGNNTACSPEVIQLLALSLPQESYNVLTMPRRIGQQRTPLSMAWRNAFLLGSVGSNKIGSADAWEKAMLLLYMAYTGIYPTFTESSHSSSIAQSEREKKLLAIQRFQSATPPFHMLHASIQVAECPLSVFDEAIELFPEQLQQKDSSGNLPLMICLNAFGKSKSKACCDNHPHDFSTKRCKYQIQALLRRYPQAAKIPSNKLSGGGRLPLFAALDNGLSWEDGVSDIMKHHMDALWVSNDSFDCCHGFCAFMLAAAAAAGKADVVQNHPSVSKPSPQRCRLTSDVFEEDSGNVSKHERTAYVLGKAPKLELKKDYYQKNSSEASSSQDDDDAADVLITNKGESDQKQINTIFLLLLSFPDAVHVGARK